MRPLAVFKIVETADGIITLILSSGSLVKKYTVNQGKLEFKINERVGSRLYTSIRLYPSIIWPIHHLYKHQCKK